MFLFLLGVLVVYVKTGSFAIDAAATAPGVVILLILVGLLIKSEAFLPGFWLPKTTTTQQQLGQEDIYIQLLGSNPQLKTTNIL